MFVCWSKYSDVCLFVEVKMLKQQPGYQKKPGIEDYILFKMTGIIKSTL